MLLHKVDHLTPTRLSNLLDHPTQQLTTPFTHFTPFLSEKGHEGGNALAVQLIAADESKSLSLEHVGDGIES